VPDPRLSDEAACELAECFICDYVWILRKIRRGELRTAQRTLYQELAEVNLKLLHELKQRRNEKSFTKARRIEKIASLAELDAITVDARIEAAALLAAVEKCAGTCRGLMQALMGAAWRWPDVK
jgi:hypothetical protein